MLYVGDHLYTDVNMAKRGLSWRTCMIMQELEEEMEGIEEGKADASDIFFGWKAACRHNLNLLFMATEACLNNMPVLAAHLPVAA